MIIFIKNIKKKHFQNILMLNIYLFLGARNIAGILHVVLTLSSVANSI